MYVLYLLILNLSKDPDDIETDHFLLTGFFRENIWLIDGWKPGGR